MLLVVIAILPLAALSIWFAVGEMRTATRLAQSQLRFAASLVAAHQDRIVESGQHLLGAISAMPLIRSPDRKVCESFFGQLRGKYPIYANIGLFDLHGKAVCHANGSIGDFSVADRPYFAQALAGQSFVVGEARVGKSSGRLIIPFAQPVLDGSRVTGVVFASLDLGYAATALAATELPPGARVAVADRRGAVLMQHPLRSGGSDQALLFEPALLAAAREMTQGTGEWQDESGEQRIYAFAPSRSNAGGGFLAAVSLDRAQVTGAALTNLGWEVLAFALALLASGMAAWWLGGRVILRPAQQIVKTVQQLERGRLDARVPLRGGSPRGEFARIASAFNLMAESLQLRQIDVDNELARSHGAYSVLDLVLNSMQDAVVAVTRAGKFLMFNEAAARLFPLAGPELLQQQWAERLGFFHADGATPYRTDELPLVRSALGESGRHQQLVVRNPQVPEGRLLQCSWQPIQDEGGIKGGLVVLTDVTERKRAEADLVLLRKAVSRLNDIVLITEAEPIDLPGPRIVFVNEAFERLTGYTAQEAIGNTPRMLQGPGTDPAALARIRAALKQGRAVREEVINYAKDGRRFWLEVDIVALAGEAGGLSHLISVQRDITARKEAERALLESERELHGYTQMLQRAAEAAPAILAHASLAGAMEEIALQARKVVGVHCAMVTLTQCDDQGQWLHALSMSEKYDPDDGWTFPRGAIDDSDLAALAVDSGRALLLTPSELEEHPRWRGSGGKSENQPRLRGLLAVPLVGREGEVIGSLQLSDKEAGDFTERDQYVALELAQLAAVAIENGRLFQQIRELNAGLEARIIDRTAELARQGQQYRTLAEQAPQVVWHTDGRGRTTFLNRAWYELVGGSDGEGLGHAWVERLHPDDLEDMRRNWRRSKETLQPFVGTRRLLAKDGTYHTMSYKAAPVLDEQGRPVFWVGIDADITELKATENALRGYNRDLEAFSYSISHDLRTPLGAIGGFSRALALKLRDHSDPLIGHYLDRIQAGVVKMDECIGALLSLASVVRAPLRYETVDLGVIARETLEGLQMQHPERKVEVQVQDNLVAHGDVGLLRLVMENLLGNAWKFTSRREAARIEVGRLEDGAAFYVRDNGVGFDMAFAGKLFGVFQRLHTQDEFPGTGIGLATVSRIVSRHEGRVWAESPPGGGATFFFTLA
jgi:PAS domain S-box-containing protein